MRNNLLINKFEFRKKKLDLNIYESKNMQSKLEKWIAADLSKHKTLNNLLENNDLELFNCWLYLVNIFLVTFFQTIFLSIYFKG
jgi:hypothetical protein